MKKYYELEQPTIIKSEKNVVKVYEKHGKIQVFPRVDSSKYGIGRGATIDLEYMNSKDLIKLRETFLITFDSQLSNRLQVTDEVN